MLYNDAVLTKEEAMEVGLEKGAEVVLLEKFLSFRTI
jgi:hypothetical protein